MGLPLINPIKLKQSNVQILRHATQHQLGHSNVNAFSSIFILRSLSHKLETIDRSKSAKNLQFSINVLI